MRVAKKLIYWDTCIFLAWLKNEPNKLSVVEGMEETAKAVDNKRVHLVTSVVTITEVLEGRLTAEQSKLFQKFFYRKNVHRINLDIRIATLSHEIRNYYDQQSILLGTPDCQHLATAIINNVDEFHTLDGSGKNSKKKGKLIPLSGIVAGKYKLKICEPYAKQGSLLTGLPL